MSDSKRQMKTAVNQHILACISYLDQANCNTQEHIKRIDKRLEGFLNDYEVYELLDIRNLFLNCVEQRKKEIKKQRSNLIFC